jgi:hypothetical protein
MNTRERLIELMTTYKIDRREVSELVRVKRDVVDHWLLPNESRNHQEPPEMAIELLEYKLRDRGSGTGAA